MAHVIGFKFETVNDEQRNAVLDKLIDLFDEQLGIGEKVVLSYKVEGKTARGKEKIEHIVEWLRAEPAPTLEDLGINATQNSMLAALDRYAADRIERLNGLAVAIDQKRQLLAQAAAEAEELATQRDHEDELLDKWAQAADEPPTKKPDPPNQNDDDDRIDGDLNV